LQWAARLVSDELKMCEKVTKSHSAGDLIPTPKNLLDKLKYAKRFITGLGK